MTRADYWDALDLRSLFPKPKDVLNVLNLFGKDLNGGPEALRVTLPETIEVLKTLYKSKKQLAMTLSNREDIDRNLARLLGVLFWIGVAAAILLSESRFADALLPLGTFLLSLSFMFSDPARGLFLSVVLQFVIKPFDVGDRFTVPSLGYPTLVGLQPTLLCA